MDTLDRVWDYIQSHMEASGGKSPTIREIAAAVGISSTNTISYHLDELVDRGLIERTLNVPRGISIVGAISLYLTPRQIKQLVETGEWVDLNRVEQRADQIEATSADIDVRLTVVEEQIEDTLRANRTMANAIQELTQAAEQVFAVAARYGFDPNGSLGLAEWLQFALGELSLTYVPACVSA